MKRYFNIFAVMTFLFSFSSCGSELDYDKDDDALNKEEIVLPAGNYISFHADVDSRASLQTSQYITRPFGVYGYQYDFSNTWNAQRALATPNVFWNLNGNTKLPLKVSYSDGIYNYTAGGSTDTNMSNGQVNWTSNRYAFWAYYPYEGYNSDYFSVSGMETEGAPYITYTVDRTSTQNMYAVMTGGISQVTAANSGNTVTFTMYHRLSAVDVSISNAYEHEYVVDGINHTEDVNIVITNLKLTFNNLKYNTAKIFLEKDKTIPALSTVLTPLQTVTPEASAMVASYQLIGANPDIAATATIAPTTTTKTNLTAGIDANATMTFIPQETEDLSVKVEGTYHMIGKTTGARIKKLRVNEDGEPLDANGYVTNNTNAYVYDDEFTIDKTTNFNQALVEGTRYFIVLNFTSEAVSINIITAEAWDDKTIDYEFM